MDNIITIALAKGRLAEKTVELMEKCGIRCQNILEASRKLVFFDLDNKYRFIMVKPTDVPTYVEYGVADIGICGKDTLLEENKQVYEMLDLKFGACKLCIAGFKDNVKPLTSPNLRVATKYVNIARELFKSRGINVEIIKLSGSIELGPIINLSDVILDIVESGRTLVENNLVILEEITDISARLIVNQVSLKTNLNIIKPLINNLKEHMEKK
jgi:ATP phosphoribosyltransferase